MIGWRDGGEGLHRDSLFGVFAALARGDAWSFPALRPHQREPWHAFTVQVAALALIRAGRDDLPGDEATWRDLLIALTPDQPDGEAWTLVVDDWSKPALLQPPILDAAFRKDKEDPVLTADRLDMLVISRNHEIKRERMSNSSEEDWLFALVTLQTAEGRMGAGRFGISRMNSGYGTRMSLGVRPTAAGEAGTFRRDVKRLVADSASRRSRREGLKLLWTVPWDGEKALSYVELDELYVEICRRVRLRHGPSGIEALTVGSAGRRVAAKQLGGNTKDPWAPLIIDTNKTRDTFGKLISVTPGGEGFSFRQMAKLLDSKVVTAPLLAGLHPDDDPRDLALVASALVRGQGKTEGLHRRIVRTSRIEEIDQFAEGTGDGVLDRVGNVAKRRADDAAEASRRLRRALIILMSSGDDRDDLMRARDGDAEAWTSALRRFDETVDKTFFAKTFWAEVVEYGSAIHRHVWCNNLRVIAETTLNEAAEYAPRTKMRRDKAQSRAENRLEREMDAWLREISSGEHV